MQNRLDALKLSDVEDRLNKLRLLIFDRKIHNAVKRLSSVIRKHVDADLKGKIQELSMIGDDGDDAVGKFVEQLVVAKLVKICHSKVVASERQRQRQGQNVGNKSEQDTDEDGDKEHRRLIPAWYEGCEFNVIFNDKSNERNPSYVWKEVILKIDGAEKFSSKMWNNGKVKELLHSFEDGMDVFLCINRDEKLKQRKEKRANEQHGEVEVNDVSDRETGGSLEGKRPPATEDDTVNFDENSLEQYDDMLVASSSESESESEEGIGSAERNLENHEESASSIDESDDDNDTGTSTVKKYNLPELMAGYYSGDDDEDDDQATPEWDKTAMEQISNQEEKRKKKNRRGQRARRKIWEQKYGRRANHIQKELKEKEAKRLKRQREYEERASRRAAKQAKFDQTNTPVATPNEQLSKPQADKAEHPSWVAKRLAAERLKTSKFQGKKITFD